MYSTTSKAKQKGSSTFPKIRKKDTKDSRIELKSATQKKENLVKVSSTGAKLSISPTSSNSGHVPQSYSLGNLVQSSNLQPKLKIGGPADRFEQEADRMAEQVMNMPEAVQREPVQSGGKFPFAGMPAECKRHSIKESPSGPPAKNKFRVRVCTDTNELFVEDLKPPHKINFHALVVTGGEKTPTPKGKFRLKIWEKDYTTPRWKEQSCTKFSEDPFGRNVFGPYIIRFKGGYFIHGTVGPGISPITLNGIAMGNLAGSHGCIRMSNLDLKRLHDGLLSNPVGTELIVTTCGTPPEADVESVSRVTFSLGDEKKLGFEDEFRLFLPTLLERKLQPFIFTGVGTSSISGGIGTSIDPFLNISLFLAGKIGLRTEWFHSIDIGGGAEAGWAFGKSRSLRLGIGWEMWQRLNENKKRDHLLNLFLGFRF